MNNPFTQPKAFITLLLLLIAFVSQGQTSEVFSTAEGAIGGYDPVAYFLQQKPVKGEANIYYEWKEAKWHFASTSNREMFIKNPEKYAPQYGGYCAYGVGEGGYKAATVPEAWAIVNQKLYLNYNQTVQKSWMAKKEAYIKQADQKWPLIKREK